MKRMILLCLSSVASAAAFAEVPVVRNVVVSQDPRTHLVRINYELVDGPALVAIDVQTNGASVGILDPAAFHDPYGDASGVSVNRIVRNGPHTLLWNPEREMPGAFLAENAFSVVLSAYATNSQPDFIAIDLTRTNALAFYRDADEVPFGVTNALYKTTCLLMRRIPSCGVTWRMGSPVGEGGRQENRETPHYVTFAQPDYYMGVFEMTQCQYELVMGENPSTWKDAEDSPVRPVDNLSYNTVRGSDSAYSFPSGGSAVDPTLVLGHLRVQTGLQFDLPTDAQWEYACRGGVGGPFNDGANSPNAVGWYSPNSTSGGTKQTHEVGLKPANAFGLYDMHGNVWEINRCLVNTSGTMSGDPVTDPDGDTTGPGLIRGGAYSSSEYDCRAARRNELSRSVAAATLGLRLWCPALSEK